MTTAQYNEEIKRLEGEIASKQAKADALKKSGQSWIDDAYKTRKCTGTRSQKDACKAENIRKTNVGNGYIQQANELLKQITEHRSRIAELRELAQKSALTDSEVSKILASQGKTNESILLFTEKAGDAEIEKQRIIAQSEAEAVTQQTATNKKVTYAVIGVVLLGAIVGAVFLIKKFRKK